MSTPEPARPGEDRTLRTLGGTDIKRLNRHWRRRSSGRVALVLAGLSNPFNVGAILRTSAVLGVEMVYLVGTTPGPGDAKVAKTGLGTEHSVSTRRVDAVGAATAEARTAGFTVVAVELARGAVPLADFSYGPATCLVIGNEGHGLSPAELAECDAAVYVPQVGKVASLNVATAAAIAVYEVRRWEWSGPGGRAADEGH